MDPKIESRINALAQKLIDAKLIEADAKKVRIEAEEKIIFECVTSGKTTAFKFTITPKEKVEIDEEVLESLGLDKKTVEGIMPSTTTTTTSRKLNKDHLSWLQDNDPKSYLLLSKAITTSPLKTAVKVEKAKVKKS